MQHEKPSREALSQLSADLNTLAEYQLAPPNSHAIELAHLSAGGAGRVLSRLTYEGRSLNPAEAQATYGDAATTVVAYAPRELDVEETKLAAALTDAIRAAQAVS